MKNRVFISVLILILAACSVRISNKAEIVETPNDIKNDIGIDESTSDENPTGTGFTGELEIDSVEVDIMVVVHQPNVQLNIKGHYLDGCSEITKGPDKWYFEQEGRLIKVIFNPDYLPDADCSAGPRNFFRGMGVNAKDMEWETGEYFVEIHGFQTSFEIEEEIINKWNDVKKVIQIVSDDFFENFGIEGNVQFNFGIPSIIWSDSCLELPEEGEICEDVEIPGYSIVLKNAGEKWEYHTNSDGSIFRKVPWKKNSHNK